MPRTSTVVVVILATALLTFGASAQAPAPPAARPKLVVVIVVDQMRADYIERFHDRWNGGLRRLVDRGAWFTNAAYPYAETETCPGHATISTGVFPARSGIVGNTWYERQTPKVVTCTQDSSAHDIGLDRTSNSGDSAVQLLVPSFSEQLQRANGKTVALAGKARAAIMLAGHRADAVLWNDENTGELSTSSAYSATMPDFARDFARANPLSGEFAKVWTLSAPAATYKGGRSVEGENPPWGWTATFPHPLSAGEKTPGDAESRSKFVQRWRASPFSDAWFERLTEAAIDNMKLGKSSGTDFLGIGLSATDYIGHAFGPDSLEIEDQMLRLDQTIGALLRKLDSTVGSGNYVIALSADHGVAPIPEQAKLRGIDAGRVNSSSVANRINAAIAERLGPGKYVAQTIGSDLYLASTVSDRLNSDNALWQAIQQAALAEPGVQRIVRRTTQNSSETKDALLRALSFDFFPERSGDIWIDLKLNWILSARTANGWAGGTTHGSHNDYDQRVPLLLFGARIKPGRYTMRTSPADIAPTLAALTNIQIAKNSGRILQEAFASRATK
ncbi:MAG TPA: alkaline phosphatase family protein [Bryobacteraceae bacterium]